MRLRYIISLTGLFPALLWANPPHSLPNTMITVYTTQAYKIQYGELANRLYFIDAVDNVENSLAARFSTQPDIAEQQAKTFLSSPEGVRFQQQLQEAYVGLTEAWKTGVMKVPAIVFADGQSEPKVIYGESNVSKAIARYTAFNKG